MVAIRQPSFAGGELSPTLYGRSDLAKYAVGARRLRNFFVTPHGAAMNRPGTRQGSASAASGVSRIWPFIVSDTEAYCLEFKDHALYFHCLDANGVPGALFDGIGQYSLVTPWAAADLPFLSFSQSGDILTVTRQGYAPREIQHIASPPAASPWFQLVAMNTTPFDFYGSAAPCLQGNTLTEPDGASRIRKKWEWKVTMLAKDRFGRIFESAPLSITQIEFRPRDEWSAAVTYASGDYAATAAGSVYQSIQNNNKNHALTDAAWWASAAVIPTVSTLQAIPSAGVVLYSDRPITIRPQMGGSVASISWPTGTGTLPAVYQILSYQFYRGRSPVFGFIGSSATLDFTDEGWDPDYTSPPPQGTDPFAIKNNAGTITGYDYPAVVTSFEGRRVFANTPNRPTSIFGSSTESLSNFDASTPAKDSDSYEFALASSRREEIRALVPSRVLVALTSSSEWSIDGGQPGEPITPNGVSARPHSARGSAWVQPLEVGAMALFVQRGATTVRGLDFSQGGDSLHAADLSLLAKHLFAGHRIVAWAYAQEPHSIVWVVREDGMLLSFTYEQDHEVWAWAWHETSAGDAFEDVCVVPVNGEDGVWVVARRIIGGVTRRIIERLVTPSAETVQNAVYLDCYVSRSGAPATVVSGLGVLEHRVVMAVADGVVVGPYTVQGGQIDLSPDLPAGAAEIRVGLPFVAELETLDLAAGSSEIRTRQRVVKEVAFEVANSRGLWVGEDYDHLIEWRQRQVSDSYGPTPPFTGAVHVAVAGRWGTSGRAVLRQVDPLPCIVLGITREVEFGGSGPT